MFEPLSNHGYPAKQRAAAVGEILRGETAAALCSLMSILTKAASTGPLASLNAELTGHVWRVAPSRPKCRSATSGGRERWHDRQVQRTRKPGPAAHCSHCIDDPSGGGVRTGQRAAVTGQLDTH